MIDSPAHPTSEQVQNHLFQIVDEFNEKLEHWKEHWKCEANLQWGYHSGRALEVHSISYPVYRKGLPASETMEELAKKMAKMDSK